MCMHLFYVNHPSPLTFIPGNPWNDHSKDIKEFYVSLSLHASCLTALLAFCSFNSDYLLMQTLYKWCRKRLKCRKHELNMTWHNAYTKWVHMPVDLGFFTLLALARTMYHSQYTGKPLPMEDLFRYGNHGYGDICLHSPNLCVPPMP